MLPLGLLALCLAAPLAAQSEAGAPSRSPDYHITRRIAVGGGDGWDYLAADSGARRLYISRGTHVVIIDTDRDSVVGDIPDIPGVHGIALAPELGRGFTSDGRDSSVTIFDLKTHATLGRVLVTGRNPDAILYDPASRRVFTFNGGSDNATAIDAATGAVAGTIALGGRPEFAVADGQGLVYVNLESRNALLALDSRTLAVHDRWPLAPCTEPSGLAMDRAHHRLLVGCRNEMMAIVDAQSGRVVTTLPIGRGVDANTFDPDLRLAFSSNGDGTLTVVHEDAPDRFRVVQTVETQRGARTMALDERTHKIYLSVARFAPAPAGQRPAVVPGSFEVLVVERRE
jgi:YVTN family beta-propeller protein